MVSLTKHSWVRTGFDSQQDVNFTKILQNGTTLNVNQSLDEVHTSYYLMNVAEWHASRQVLCVYPGSIPKYKTILDNNLKSIIYQKSRH